MRRAAVLLAAAAAVVTACGTPDARVARPPYPVQTQIVGGTAAQQSLMKDILRRVDARAIERIRIVATEDESGAKGVDLHMSRGGGRMIWTEFVVALAFRDESIRRRLPPVIYVSGADNGRIDAPNAPPRRGGDVRASAVAIRHAARRSGVQVREIEVMRPDGIAAVVAVASKRPVAFLRGQAGRRFSRAIGAAARDGVFFELYDGRGRLFMRSYRVLDEVDFVWVRPPRFRGSGAG